MKIFVLFIISIFPLLHGCAAINVNYAAVSPEYQDLWSVYDESRDIVFNFDLSKEYGTPENLKQAILDFGLKIIDEDHIERLFVVQFVVDGIPVEISLDWRLCFVGPGFNNECLDVKLADSAEIDSGRSGITGAELFMGMDSKEVAIVQNSWEILALQGLEKRVEDEHPLLRIAERDNANRTWYLMPR